MALPLNPANTSAKYHLLRLALAVILLLAVSLMVGCTSEERMNEKIMIRVRNESTLNFENAWLGAGERGGATQTTAYGGIKAGDTSTYKEIDALLANYRKIDIVADGTRYLDTIDPAAHVGTPELGPGRYTFAYAIIDGKLSLTLIVDPEN